MQYFLIFLAELSFLFLLSKSLTRTLSKVLFSVTKSRTTTTTIIALLFFPGVVIHELSHMLTAGVLFVPVGDIDLMPKITGDGELRLGSVMIGQTDILRRAVVGLAPLLIGLTIILGVPFLLKDRSSLLYSLIIVYLLFEVGNTMFSSNKDLEGMVELIIVLSLLIFAFYIANFRLPIDFLSSLLNKEPIVAFFKQINIFMMWPLAIDLISVVILKIVPRRT